MSKEQRRPPTLSMPQWKRREEMILFALSKSVPWLAFINLSFAVIIIFRNQLFSHFDAGLSLHGNIFQTINIMMFLTMLMSAVMAGAAVIASKNRSAWLSHILDISLLLISLIWSFCCYIFVTFWALPIAYPLAIILMLTALAGLYFYPRGLLLSVFPLWITVLAANITLYSEIYVRFFVIWVLFTLILIYGRQILQRWFNENWERHQDNLLLITRLETIANQDPLTETANRRAMEVHLNMAINRNVPFSLIMLDVDYFKRYNDHYGHQAGDECLVKMAKILKAAVRTPEDVVARYGGEEFLLLLPDASAKEAELVAERIHKLLMQEAIPHLQSDVSDIVTVSMGIASSGDDKSVAELISAADSALYRAKSQGRNRWCG
ncbi:GGDEF domain-containing protein [Rahnella selenatireducens]|uniref:GGDEF domain-containing protein n=1 Tax=Rahnella selenatireducens TaxID=3389797 RepID=UPI0039681B2F